MGLSLTIPAVSIGDHDIPERTFHEGVDMTIDSNLQEGRTIYRETMLVTLHFGDDSQEYRDYAQRIGLQQAKLNIS